MGPPIEKNKRLSMSTAAAQRSQRKKMDKSGEYGKLISSFDQMRNGKKRLLEAHRTSEKIRDKILDDLRSDFEESSIVSINERKKGNKKTKRANDPISKVLKAN